MACFEPLTAYYGKVRGESGKRPLVFDKRRAFSPVPVKLACGQCVGCRVERGRMWAVRCMHEKQVSSSSMFLTLTYDDRFLPKGGTLVLRDLQLFLKRLRRRFGNGIRFYGCGEYGEHTKRPHYHLLLFNCCVGDLKYLKEASSGAKLYTSKIIGDLWPFGFNVVGNVDYDSCSYVASYISKKITGDKAEAHYNGRLPEFNVMSRRPGIAAVWYSRFGEHSMCFDNVVFKNRLVKVPKFYDGRFEAHYAAHVLDWLKVERRRKAMLRLSDNTRDRLRVRGAVARGALRLKQEVL